MLCLRRLGRREHLRLGFGHFASPLFVCYDSPYVSPYSYPRFLVETTVLCLLDGNVAQASVPNRLIALEGKAFPAPHVWTFSRYPRGFAVPDRPKPELLVDQSITKLNTRSHFYPEILNMDCSFSILRDIKIEK